MHYLATSKFSIAMLANLGFVLTMIAYKIIIKVRTLNVGSGRISSARLVGPFGTCATSAHSSR